MLEKLQEVRILKRIMFKSKAVIEGNSSGKGCVDPQVAADEAFARQLQELENELSVASLEDFSKTETEIAIAQSLMSIGSGHSSSSPSNTPDQQDLVDPDNMTYEELQELGEAMGKEKRGLPDELIRCLPSSRYKTGLFSGKGKQECVICCMVYKYRDKLTTLPCLHQYHFNCVTKWLKINKACPICNVEVFGP